MGSPFDKVNGVRDTGSVSVIFGSAAGLTAAGDQLWTQNSPEVIHEAEEVDLFGLALAAGDFDGDGFDDLAVSVIGEEAGIVAKAGANAVLYGSAAGLTAVGDQLWTQDSPGVLGAAGTGDLFGVVLA